MRILVVTGKLAEGQVKEMLSKYARGIKADLKVLPIPVAAMITPALLEEELRGIALDGYDAIMVPGMAPGDYTGVSERLGVPVWKGPRRASDIPLVLEALAEGIQLSSSRPADDLMAEKVRGKVIDLLARAEDGCQPAARVGGLCIPLRPPPIRIVAELPPSLPSGKVEDEARRLVESGAEIVVVGLGGGHGEYEARTRIRAAMRAGVPVGVDTASPEIAAAAVEEGASIVFSLTSERLRDLQAYAGKAAFVVIPWKNGVPRDPGERLDLLSEALEKAERLGYSNLIVDPVLLPPAQGLAESIKLYVEASRRFKHPLLAGISNVTELVDIDSIGVNGLATMLLAEAGVSLLLTTEESWKARGSVAEAKIAAAMASASLVLGSPPKDLGIDLLVLKEKRPGEPPLKYRAARRLRLKARVEAHRLDPRGYVKIQVRDGLLEACLFRYGSGEAEICVEGEDGLSVARKLAEEAGISDASHMAYIAYELSKAEIALKLGKTYIQEGELFETVREKMAVLTDMSRRK